MKTLIVEDDFSSRICIQGMLHDFGPSEVAINGNEALEAVRMALDKGEPYDLICLDIMMPEMGGHEALVGIRELEESHDIQIGHGAKVVMTTGLADKDNVLDAFRQQCDGYLVKPIERGKLLTLLNR
jgi:two-component system, chemotaxis family, chemotaxis protein CheY